MHLVGSCYTDVSRCTVNETLNLKLTTNCRLLRGLRIDGIVIAFPTALCSVVLHSVLIVTVCTVHTERLYTCMSDMLVRFLVQITSYVVGVSRGFPQDIPGD